MFCKHKWEVISETTTKSKYETAIDATKNCSIKEINFPPELCCAKRKFILIVTCSKCGKLKRFVENI